MLELLQWTVSFLGLAAIGGIIVWDARTERKERRQREEQQNNDR